jgi:hypothetical protein
MMLMPASAVVTPNTYFTAPQSRMARRRPERRGGPVQRREGEDWMVKNLVSSLSVSTADTEGRRGRRAGDEGRKEKRATTRRRRTRLEFFGNREKRIHVCPSALAWYVVFVCENERDWCVRVCNTRHRDEPADGEAGKRISPRGLICLEGKRSDKVAKLVSDAAAAADAT